jgi:deazaflavin-dependent oxidoreductase (nitroreductase family)
MADERRADFLPPSFAERILNRVFGALVGIGFGLRHNYLLQVRGRKTGRLYSTPVDVLEMNGRCYLVCPRGRAQWVRNAEACGRVTLKKRGRQEFALTAVTGPEKPVVLKNYLDRYKTTVQRYFPIPAGSPASAFVPYRDRYPVFELTRTAH